MADKTKVFLANVMDAYVYTQSGDLLFTSKALTDSSISIGITAEDIRGGKGNKLIGRFFHDSTFGLELQDALFNLNYVALNVGTDVVRANDGALTEEEITATGAGKLTVSGSPVDAFGFGRIGWIATSGSDDWAKFEFDEGLATAQNVALSDGTTLIAGDKYCVKYANDTICDEVIIPGNFVPSEVSVILKGDLYKAGKSNDVSVSSVVGHIEVEVPRFQLNGSMDISLNSSGASQIPFAGQALVADDGGCEGGGRYAKIKDIRSAEAWYTGLIGIAIEGTDAIVMAPGATKAVRTYGVFSGSSSRLITPDKLSYNLSPGTATGTTIDSSTGIITAGTSQGSGTLEISVVDKPAINVTASVEVTE